jgi:hypothetical protein
MRAAQDWGLDINMAALLVAAFAATNALSLLYLAVIAVGMAAPAGPRRLIWRAAVLPVLALLLLLQYSLCIGPPPLRSAGPGDGLHAGSTRQLLPARNGWGAHGKHGHATDPEEPSLKVRAAPVWAATAT